VQEPQTAAARAAERARPEPGADEQWSTVDHAHAAMDMELEHGGAEDEDDRRSYSSSKRSFGASSDATVSSTPSKLQALRFAEDLSLPSVRSLSLSLSSSSAS
jgi:methylphosphotriester-DNA--protein-cysteine methyltransferase